MLGVGRRARAPVAASSAQRGHRVVDAPCSASLTELVRGSAAATTGAVTTIVLLEDYTHTRVKPEVTLRGWRTSVAGRARRAHTTPCSTLSIVGLSVAQDTLIYG